MATARDSSVSSSIFSLVKYETPILVTSKGSKTRSKTRSKGPTFVSEKARQSSAKVGRHDLRNRDHTSELLDTILPPREFEEAGSLWIQSVSKTPATRLDVVNLQERLDMKLSERQARELGICPVRRELYDQCFDELIRQETLNCTERGLLLLRVRDELRMTLAAYETLYESSIAFGIRKALLAEKGKFNVEDQVRMLLFENAELREKLKEQEMEFTLKQNKLEQKMAVEDQRHTDEVDFLKQTNNQLKAQLKAVVGTTQEETEAESFDQDKSPENNDFSPDINPSF